MTALIQIAEEVLVFEKYAYDAYSDLPELEKEGFPNRLDPFEALIFRHILEKYELGKEVSMIRKSKAYRIGRAVTFVPRKIRGGVMCVTEHGWKYTIKHAGVKMKKTCAKER